MSNGTYSILIDVPRVVARYTGSTKNMIVSVKTVSSLRRRHCQAPIDDSGCESKAMKIRPSEPASKDEESSNDLAEARPRMQDGIIVRELLGCDDLHNEEKSNAEQKKERSTTMQLIVYDFNVRRCSRLQRCPKIL